MFLQLDKEHLNADLAIDSYAISEETVAGDDGDASVVVKNNLATSIIINDFVIYDDATGTDMAANVTLMPGQTTTLTGSTFTCSAGGSCSYIIEITYEDSATGATYTVDGNGHTLDGDCAVSIS